MEDVALWVVLASLLTSSLILFMMVMRMLFAKLDLIHDLVNSNMTEALQEIQFLKGEVLYLRNTISSLKGEPVVDDPLLEPRPETGPALA